MSKIVKRSLKIAGHLTSVSLEQEFWDAIKAIAKDQNRSVADLVAEIDRDRVGGLSSTLRVYALQTLQAQLNTNSEHLDEGVPTEAS